MELGQQSEFVCPMDCIGGLVEVFGGQYWLDFELPKNPVIIDIGANVGAFTLMALWRWSGAEVLCYEPEPQIFNYLSLNTCRLPNVRRMQRAVVGDAAYQKHVLVPGRNRLCGRVACAGGDPTREVAVEVDHVGVLPQADLVKVDVEGEEKSIVPTLMCGSRKPGVIIVEYHSAESLCVVGLAGINNNYALVHSQVCGPGWGVVTFKRGGAR